MIQAQCFGNVQKVVSVVEGYIENKLNVPDELDDYIIYSVPVMHMEAWLSAACKRRPFKRNIEHVKIKKLAQRYLEKRFQQPLKDAAKQASEMLGRNINVLRCELDSLEHFARKVDSAL